MKGLALSDGASLARAPGVACVPRGVAERPPRPSLVQVGGWRQHHCSGTARILLQLELSPLPLGGPLPPSGGRPAVTFPSV